MVLFKFDGDYLLSHDIAVIYMGGISELSHDIAVIYMYHVGGINIIRTLFFVFSIINGFTFSVGTFPSHSLWTKGGW